MLDAKSINQTCMPVGSPFGRRWSAEACFTCTIIALQTTYKQFSKQSYHRHPMSLIFVPNPHPQTLAPPRPPHSSSLPVPSRCGHLWRPPRSVRAIKDFPKPPCTSGRGSRLHVSGGWSARYHQHRTDRLEPWQHPQTRRSSHWSDRKRPSNFLGRCPARSWHHHSFVPPDMANHGAGPGNTQEPAWPKRDAERSVHTPSSVMRSRRCRLVVLALKQEEDGAKKPPVLSSSSRANPTSTPPPLALGICPHQPMDGPVDLCCVASLCRQPPRPRLRPSYQCQREWSFLERTPGRGPSSTLPSPTASHPLIKEVWLGLGRFPRNAGATGIKVANSFRPILETAQ